MEQSLSNFSRVEPGGLTFFRPVHLLPTACRRSCRRVMFLHMLVHPLGEVVPLPPTLPPIPEGPPACRLYPLDYTCPPESYLPPRQYPTQRPQKRVVHILLEYFLNTVHNIVAAMFLHLCVILFTGGIWQQ